MDQLIPGAYEKTGPIDPLGLATCPTCHTADTAVTNATITAGGDWRCTRCGQRWDTVRLAVVAGYAAWAAGRVPISRRWA